MSTRLYDYIITVGDASAFRTGNNIIGLNSGTVGYIAAVDTVHNNIKVKVHNVFQEFSTGESVVSNHSILASVRTVDTFPMNSNSNVSVYTLTYTTPTANGEYGNTTAIARTYNANIYILSEAAWGSGFRNPPTSELNVYVNNVYQHPETWTYESSNNSVIFRPYVTPVANTIVRVVRSIGNVALPSFVPSFLSIGNSVTSASSTVSAIYNSPFIRSKNAFTQPPIVRMLTFYYPGEWYPPNDVGNPTGTGAGYAWPANMPWRIAEVVGDYFSDLYYNVTFDGDSYLAYPMETDGIGTSSDGTIDRVTMRISNYDNLVSTFVENPYLVGKVTSTNAPYNVANPYKGYVNGELVDNLDPVTIVTGAFYDADLANRYYGTSNATWSYDRAIAMGQEWQNLKYDSRDFLGGVVEIKSTLASHLQYWPEYSKLTYIHPVDSNVIQVINSAPYRVGDVIKTPTSTSTPIISAVLDDNYIILASTLTGASDNEALYIVNPEYDPDAYIKDTFKVTELSALNENFAEFTLTSWLQYFKLQLPKRKYYKNTCQWEYKGAECQYPGPGGGIIPGSSPPVLANTNPINTNNEVCALADDECSKSYEACRLRNNTLHYGGFPGTGRQIPRQ